MKRLKVANGTYQTRDGETKTRWVDVGMIGVSQAGKEYMMIDPAVNFAAFPRKEGRDMVMVSIFEDKPKETGMNSPVAYQDTSNEEELTVPF